MGVVTTAVLLGAAAATAVAGGVMAKNAGDAQANQAEVMATMQSQESMRVAQKEAGIEMERADAVRRSQKVAALASGVTLEGSPLLVMEETRKKGLSNIDEILKGGAASSSNALQEGRVQSSSLKASGRQAFVSGLGQAAGYGGQAASALKKPA